MNNKYTFWVVTSLVVVTCGTLFGVATSKMNILTATTVSNKSVDSTVAAAHASLPMHAGTKEALETIDDRYKRDSTDAWYKDKADSAFHEEIVAHMVKVDSSMSALTQWLMSNTNRDSATNGSRR